MECLNNSNIKPQKQIHVQQTNRNNLESISKILYLYLTRKHENNTILKPVSNLKMWISHNKANDFKLDIIF